MSQAPHFVSLQCRLWCALVDLSMSLLAPLHCPATRCAHAVQGLGEMMPEQLWATTMDPARRTLRRLSVADAAAASDMFGMLMGDKPALRRALIEKHAAGLQLEELDV